MSERRRDEVADLLGRLREPPPVAGRAPRSPALTGRGRRRALEARVLGRRDAEADPITGHRGSAAATQVVASGGDVVIEAQVRREGTRLVLRGQVLVPAGARATLRGGLVHVRGAGACLLAPLAPTGEFVVTGLGDAAVGVLEVELDDIVVRVDWPAGNGEPGP